MKYYQYIADSKVDMLLPQIPLTFKQSISASLGTDIKIFSAKYETTRTTLDDRVSRLIAVTKFIESNEKVGSITEPNIWIKGTCHAKYGYLGNQTKIVGFSGKDHGTSFLLVGSSGHIVGSEPTDAEIGKGFSFLPRLLDYLQSATKWSEEDGLVETPHIQTYLGGVNGDTKASNWRMLISDGDHSLKYSIEIEFLAKKLMHSERDHNGDCCLLASPLYVSMLG